MDPDLLSIYLADHSALMRGELELVKRCRGSNESLPGVEERELARYLLVLQEEVAGQQEAIGARLERAGSGPSAVKEAGAWLAEKLGRLKLNGDLTRYSELSRVIEIEALLAAATSRVALWSALAQDSDGAREAGSFRDRSSEHVQRLTELHSSAVRLASVREG